MKRIVVQVSWSEKNYCGGWGDPSLGAVLSTGKTLEAFKQEFEDALRFHIKGMAESGTAPEWAVKGEYEVEYSLHISAVLRQALASVPNHVTIRLGWSFSIADKIDAKLKELGMSHREFAKRVGKTEPEVTRWLSGTHNFTLRTLAKISDALGENLIEA